MALSENRNSSEIEETKQHPSHTLPEIPKDSILSKRPGDKHRVLRYWITCCAVFLILAPLLSVVLGVKLHTKDFSYTHDTRHPDLLPVFNGRTLLLETVLISADPMNSLITFDWTIMPTEVNSPCSSSTVDKCTDVNIFFDSNLLAETDTTDTRTSGIPDTPVFQHNAALAASQDIRANTPTFRTNLQLFSPQNHQSSLIFYPFDIYTAEIFIFAQDAVTNDTVGIMIVSTRGNAVGFATDAIDFPDTMVPAGMLDIFVTLQRGNLIRAFCVIATIAVWLITLVLLLLMFTSIIFGFRQRSEVLIVPVATVFAFTQLRGSMPGAPAGFGDVLDFVGLLPCLGFLSVAAAVTLGAFILKDPGSEKHEELSIQLLHETFPLLQSWKRLQNRRTSGPDHQSDV